MTWLPGDFTSGDIVIDSLSPSVWYLLLLKYIYICMYVSIYVYEMMLCHDVLGSYHDGSLLRTTLWYHLFIFFSSSRGIKNTLIDPI